MAGEEGVEIQLDDPAPPAAATVVVDPLPGARTAVPVAAPVAEPTAPVTDVVPRKIETEADGIEDLKAQVERAKEESRRRLQEADRKIQEAFHAQQTAAKRAADAEKEVTTVRQSAVATALDSLNRDKEDAKREYRAAMEAGDFEKAANAQDKLSLANARIVEAEKGKLELEERAKNPPQATTAASPVTQRVAPADDPVEQFIQGMPANSANWIRTHPEYARDPKLTRKMVRAHEDAVDEGYMPDSPAYFRYVEQTLGINGARAPAAASAAPAQRAAAPASAPVSRDVTQSPGAQPASTKIHLSGSEQRTAVETLSPLYPGESEDQLLRRYATQKRNLMSEGKIGRVAS